MKKKKKSFAENSDREDALSPEELAMFRATARQSVEDRSKLPPHDTSDRARLRRFIKKNKALTAACIIIAVALLIGIACGIAMLFSYLNSRPNKSDFTILLGEEKPYTVPYNDAVYDGVFYVDMNKIAKFGDMIIGKTQTGYQFTAAEDNYLLFENNSEIAIINGNRVEMVVTPLHGTEKVTAKALFYGDQCLVPYDFLIKTVSSGLRFRLNTSSNTLTVKRDYHVYDGDLDNKVAANILFNADQFTLLPSLTEPPVYEYSYLFDISAFLDSITSEHLVLTNKQNPLGNNYEPSDLTVLTCATDGEAQQLRADAANALYAMMREMEAVGLTDIYVTSSYRSYSYQNNLYNKYVSDHMAEGMSREEAEAAASAYSARPGESEHQTGLCLDFTTDSIGGVVDDVFEETAAFVWLSENAYRFGFILRYPEDKVSVTQYDYEPWHYRFVGRQAASEIHFSGICLEEYLSSAR